MIGVFLAAALAGCGEKHFTQPMVLGGQEVSAETLNAGREAYIHYCRACHGDEGKGDGPASFGLRPRPRDFTKGEFKFAQVANGQLPRDEDLIRIVRGGLHGTAMLPWDDIPDQELSAIIQYIKTFSPKWEKKKPGDKIEIAPDPWVGKEKEAIARGRVVYHAKAMCATCHPAYVTLQEYYEMTKAETGTGATELRQNAYLPLLTDNKAYGKIQPPDFAFRTLRSGEKLEDIYRSVASGIGGTAMPKWKGVLSEQDLWALVHYVKYLTEIRGTEEAAALRAKLENPPPWSPPATPATPEQGVAPAPTAPGATPTGAAPTAPGATPTAPGATPTAPGATPTARGAGPTGAGPTAPGAATPTAPAPATAPKLP